MRNDNKRLKDFQDKHEVLDKKRNQIYSMILSTYRDLKDRLNLIAQDNMAITTSLEEIKAKLD